MATSKKKGAAGEREIAGGRELQEAILTSLGRLATDGSGKAPTLYKSRRQFEAEIDGALKRSGIDVPGPVKKAIMSALSERDGSAEICTDAKGRPEPDTDLRDYENVPLKEDIAAYFDREVGPHVPDAWIAGIEIRGGKAVIVDESKVRVGYEIPVTRQFYKYTPLRPLGQIEKEIRQLEGEIQGLLGEALA